MIYDLCAKINTQKRLKTLYKGGNLDSLKKLRNKRFMEKVVGKSTIKPE